MDDDMDSRDDWLTTRLRAAARDAHTVARRRLLLPAVVDEPRPRARMAWVGRHRLVLGLLAVNAATGATAVALGVSLGQRGSEPGGGGAAPAAEAPSAGSVAGAAALPFDVRADTTRTPPSIALGFGSVWLGSLSSGTVVRVDERTLRITATITVDPAAGSVTGVATDGTSLWATAGAARALVRIDPASGRVTDSVDIGVTPAGLTVAGGTVWVTSSQSANGPGSLLEVDAARHRVVASFAVGAGPGEVSAAGGAVWVVNGADGTLSRLDIASGRVRTTRPNPGVYDFGYVSVAADASGAWAVDNNRAVLEHVDGTTMTAGTAVGLGLARTTGTANVGPRCVSVTATARWVVNGAQLLEVDAGGRTASVDVASARAVAAGDGAVWVLAGDRSHAELVKVDPAA